jgi:hypothetical protein
MRKPTMSLHDVQRILADQDRDLQAAYRALKERTDLTVMPSAEALKGLREVCAVRPLAGATKNAPHSIRC